MTQINECRTAPAMMPFLGESNLASEEDDMKVKDVMHKGTTCVESGTPVKEIAERMRDSDVGAIPVNATVG